MKALNITLMFNGETEAVFNFYKSVFGGEFTMFQRMKDMPGRGADMPEDQKEKILYVGLPIAKGMISGMDIPAGMPPVSPGTNFTISLDMDSEEEVTRIFNGLAKGGQVRFPPGPQFWATYFGMVTDQYGVTWMLTYNK